jgi:hypothetical protein
MKRPVRHRVIQCCFSTGFFGDSELMGLEIAGNVIELGSEVRGFVRDVNYRRSLAA